MVFCFMPELVIFVVENTSKKMELKGRNIIVTGSSGGLGPAVVRNLINFGAFCYLPVRDEKEVDKMNKFLNSENLNINQIEMQSGIDLVDPEQTQQYFNSIKDKTEVWSLVNLAGGFGMGKIDETKLSELDRMLDINTKTCFNSTKEAVKILKKQKKGGRILNVASKPAEYPRQGAGLVAYSMSKSAVIALTQSVAEEVKNDNILVNAISPSIIDTPDNRQAMPKAEHNKWPKPDSIANAVCFLVSPLNRISQGAIFPVHGKV